MTEMIEKVAKALYLDGDTGRTEGDWAFRKAHQPGVYNANIRQARAAIRALMEPTEEMMTKGRHAGLPAVFPHGTPFEEADFQAALWAGYRAMLKAALDEQG